jgi:fructose-1,6-bisphosphatase II
MNKLVVGPAARGAIDIKKSPTHNLHAIAEAKRCRVDDLTIVILDRPRHEELIAEVRRSGARIRLITDGDVAPAVAASQPDSGVDAIMGIGGAPEGVLAAAAVRCIGGDMQGQLKWRSADEQQRAERMGIRDPDRIYQLGDLVQGHVMFAASGVTDGSLLRGVRFFGGGASTHSVVMRSKSGTIRFVEARHNFILKPMFDRA